MAVAQRRWSGPAHAQNEAIALGARGNENNYRRSAAVLVHIQLPRVPLSRAGCQLDLASHGRREPLLPSGLRAPMGAGSAARRPSDSKAERPTHNRTPTKTNDAPPAWAENFKPRWGPPRGPRAPWTNGCHRRWGRPKIKLRQVNNCSPKHFPHVQEPMHSAGLLGNSP